MKKIEAGAAEACLFTFFNVRIREPAQGVCRQCLSLMNGHVTSPPYGVLVDFCFLLSHTFSIEHFRITDRDGEISKVLWEFTNKADGRRGD